MSGIYFINRRCKVGVRLAPFFTFLRPYFVGKGCQTAPRKFFNAKKKHHITASMPKPYFTGYDKSNRYSRMHFNERCCRKVAIVHLGVVDVKRRGRWRKVGDDNDEGQQARRSLPAHVRTHLKNQTKFRENAAQIFISLCTQL
eukprot:SAG31_NODE_13404_length_871_cov_1.566062_1_plen_143_part_00